MKKLELRQLIRYEILKEMKLDKNSYSYMEGLITTQALQNAIKNLDIMLKDLNEEFESPQIRQFFKQFLSKYIGVVN